MKKQIFPWVILAAGAIAATLAYFFAGTDAPVGQARHGLTGEQANETLVRIGERVITRGEFADMVSRKGISASRFNNPDERRRLLDEMVRAELLAEEAIHRGLDRLPEVQRARRHAMVQAFLRQEFGTAIGAQNGETSRVAPVTEAQILEYYNSHQSEFHTAAQVRISHILVSDRATGLRLLSQAISAGTDPSRFHALVQRFSTDEATRDRLGDLGFHGDPGPTPAEDAPVPPAVVRAAMTLTAIGQVHSELLESPRGFHIIKLTGRRAAMDRTLLQATPVIRNLLWRQHRDEAMAAYFEELRRRYPVRENLENLSLVRVQQPDAGTPSQDIVNGPSEPVPHEGHDHEH